MWHPRQIVGFGSCTVSGVMRSVYVTPQTGIWFRFLYAVRCPAWSLVPVSWVPRQRRGCISQLDRGGSVMSDPVLGVGFSQLGSTAGGSDGQGRNNKPVLPGTRSRTEREDRVENRVKITVELTCSAHLGTPRALCSEGPVRAGRPPLSTSAYSTANHTSRSM